jgi:phosphoribosylanthranilate isomerase
VVRIKICCMSGPAEVALAVGAGADALGFVSAMPSGPGPIDEALIAELVPAVPPGIGTFLLTCAGDANDIIAQQRRCRTNTLQLVDEVAAGSYETLRAQLPGISLVQVIHVVDDASIADALAAAPHVHGLLLDSGRPKAAVKELGGTGRVHDWEISRAIVERATVPVFLAGGLRAENVAQAIDAVRPYGVDVCSGVRSNGRLDEGRLAAFVAAARA